MINDQGEKLYSDNADEFMYFKLLDKGELFEGNTIKMSDLIYFYPYNTGINLDYFYTNYYLVFELPSYGGKMYNTRVLEYQDNGLPESIQFAPFATKYAYYGPFNPDDYSSYDGFITIYFPNLDNTISFADSNFKNYCVQNFDTNQDGEISIFEGNEINDIDLSHSNEITSLSGIESFTNLKKLNVSNNEIGTIPTYCLPDLEELTCYYCKLTELDLSNNINLKKLSVAQDENLSIDLLHNTELEWLEIIDCGINNLNLENNTELLHLRCESTDLVQLDVSNNLKLNYFKCDNNSVLKDIYLGDTQEIQTMIYDANKVTIHTNSGQTSGGGAGEQGGGRE